MLIAACGGLEEAAGACRVRKSALADYQAPGGEGFMPADVIAALEAHCGQPIYSRALFEGLPEAAEAQCLKEEAFEATEVVADLQRKIRLATSDGVITPAEQDELTRDFERARGALAEVGAQLNRSRGR